LKQLVPEQEYNLFFGLSIRTRHVPGIVVLSSIALFVLGLFPTHHLPHVLFGVLSSWIYLRFFQRKGDVVGDLSDSFAFSTFFPEAVRPFVNIITNIIYAVMYLPLRFIGAVPNRTRPTSAADGYALPTVMPSSALDVERRRALAAKAVDARLLAQARRGTPDVPSSPPESPQPSHLSPPTSPEPIPFVLPVLSAAPLDSSTESVS